MDLVSQTPRPRGRGRPFFAQHYSFAYLLLRHVEISQRMASLAQVMSEAVKLRKDFIEQLGASRSLT